MMCFAFGNARGWQNAYCYDRRYMRRLVRRHGGTFIAFDTDRRRRLYEWQVDGIHPAPSAFEWSAPVSPEASS